MRVLLWPAALTAAVALSLGCDDSGGTGVEIPDADVTVFVRDNFFDLPNVTIDVGGSVLWFWAGGNPHDVVFNPNDVGEPPNCAPPVTFGYCRREFGTAGQFVYDCTVHPGMVGTVNVEP